MLKKLWEKSIKTNGVPLVSWRSIKKFVCLKLIDGVLESSDWLLLPYCDELSFARELRSALFD